MPVYNYQFVGPNGKIQTGTSQVKNELELEEILRAQGFWLLTAEIDPKALAKSARNAWYRRKVPRRELIEFMVHLHTQIEAGVSLVQSLESAAEEVTSPYFKTTVNNMVLEIEAGTALHEAMAHHPKAFSKQIISMVRAGEESGNLPATLREIQHHLEWVEQLASDVRQATIYPSFVLGAVVLFVLLLFSFVVPRFEELLGKMNTELPFLTQVVFGISTFAKQTWWMWILGALGAFVGVKLGRRYSKRFAHWFDNLKMKLPLFGEINRIIALYRFSHNFGVLFRSGVPILEAMKLCEGLVGNEVIRDCLDKSGKKIEQGERVHQSLREHPVFSSLVVKMVAVGEETGKLDEVLTMVSRHYGETIPRKVKKLFGYLEPTVILILIGIVGAVALAVFLPIMSLMDGLQGR